MLRILPIVMLGATFAPAVAIAQDREGLPELVAAFVAEKRTDADTDRQAAISTCIMGAFEGLDDEELKTFIVVDDFEDSFDMLLEVYPEREEIIEICEDM